MITFDLQVLCTTESLASSLDDPLGFRTVAIVLASGLDSCGTRPMACEASKTCTWLPSEFHGPCQAQAMDLCAWSSIFRGFLVNHWPATPAPCVALLRGGPSVAADWR